MPNRFRDRQLPIHLLLGILLIKNPQLAVFMKKTHTKFTKSTAIWFRIGEEKGKPLNTTWHHFKFATVLALFKNPIKIKVTKRVW